MASSIFPAVSTLAVLPSADARLLDEALPCRLRGFTRLSSLTLGDGVTHRCTELALRSLVPIAGRVRSLQLGGLRLRTKNRNLLPEFRRVTSLRLIEFHSSHNPNALGRLVSRFPALQRLYLTCDRDDRVALSAASITGLQLRVADGWQVAKKDDGDGCSHALWQNVSATTK